MPLAYERLGIKRRTVIRNCQNLKIQPELECVNRIRTLWLQALIAPNDRDLNPVFRNKKPPQRHDSVSERNLSRIDENRSLRTIVKANDNDGTIKLFGSRTATLCWNSTLQATAVAAGDDALTRFSEQLRQSSVTLEEAAYHEAQQSRKTFIPVATSVCFLPENSCHFHCSPKFYKTTKNKPLWQQVWYHHSFTISHWIHSREIKKNKVKRSDK